MFGGTLWFIWLNRNALIFSEGFEERRRSTLEHAHDWLNIVVTASSMGSLPLQRIVGTRHLSTEVWSPPSLGWVKVNVDAAQGQTSGYMSIGGVIREASGQWIRGFGKFVGICSVFEAELWGAYIGLLCAWNSGYRQVILELDNLDIVSCICREQQLIGGCLLGSYIMELCVVSIANMSNGHGDWHCSLFEHMLSQDVLLRIATVMGVGT
ncbi:hypothetical protein V6N11_009049 [Hibiscus sabdariffa]|uniref:RNase H type-1 domain-containing protein n=1 Tax=Hibiscus sabdariffa TaxID=183260 RepID=A0ABR2PQ18_9ROSI